MSKFFLFSYEGFYPRGGANDLDGVYDTIDEARAALFSVQGERVTEEKRGNVHAHICDREMTVIECWNREERFTEAGDWDVTAPWTVDLEL